MPSKNNKTRSGSRTRRKSRVTSYKYDRKTNLLSEILNSKIKKSPRKSHTRSKNKRRSSSKKVGSDKSGRRMTIKVSPRKLVDISYFTTPRKVTDDGFQVVHNRRSRKSKSKNRTTVDTIVDRIKQLKRISRG